MKPNDAAIRKRTQIAKANRTMFLWIAVASALIGAAVVVSIFLVQKITYTEKVLSEKQTTVSSLEHNIATYDELKDKLRVLDTNENLAVSKANASDQAIQVVLDALPSEANSLALGASLQTKLLNGVLGLTVDSLTVDSVIGVETLTGDDAGTAESTEDGVATEEVVTASAITFQFAVTGDQDQLRTILGQLQRSIRTIQVTNLQFEMAGSRPIMTVQAQAFYEPARTLELQDKVVPQ